MFFTHDPAVARIVGPLLGPLIAVASFVCSVGNVPLAATRSVGRRGRLRRGDRLHLRRPDHVPILDIYRRYYGLKVAVVLFAIFYAAMALAGYAVELAFGAAE